MTPNSTRCSTTCEVDDGPQPFAPCSTNLEADPDADTNKDEIGVDSMMKYFTTLGVNPETCEIFIVLEIVQATSFGLITRKGFVEGWKATGYVKPNHLQEHGY